MGASIQHLLPRGGTLSDDSWANRHRGILVLLWLHVAAIPLYGLVRGYRPPHLLLEALPVFAFTAVAAMRAVPRRGRTLASALGLLSSSAILVHLSGGLIEMHFHFFVMVVVVSLYQDWLPFLAAIGYVLLHHGIAGALDPTSVFNHPAALAHPWRWAAVHALFIAGISAASIVNWRLTETYLDHRRQAEERLRAETRLVEQLNAVGRMLAADLKLGHVVQKVTDIGTELTGAGFGAFFYNSVDESGESYLLYKVSGAPAQAFSQFPSPRNTAIFAPTFAGEGPVRLADVTADARYGQNPPYHGMPPGHLPVKSYLAVPVTSRGDVIGGLFFGHPEPARFTEDHERIVVGIAAHAGVAVHNAQLYEAQRQAREEEEAARRRLSAIEEAGRRLLAASLDVDEVLSELAALAVPRIADSCSVHVIAADGSLRQVAIVVAPGLDAVAAALEPVEQNQVTDDHPMLAAIRAGESILLEQLDDEVMEAAIPDPQVRATILSQAPTAAVFVPLVGSEGGLGAIVMSTFAASGRRLDAEDVALVEEFARRAAAHVENARLYAAQRQAAETLQHSMLPERLPVLPGLALAARYVPGGPGAEIGGDWYDVLKLPDGQLALVMGDVVGRGIAAAALMSQLRNALRALVLEGYGPADVLSRLNLLITEVGPGAQMATVLYATLDSEAGQLRFASAGHPPLAVLAPDGSVSLLDAAVGVPVGALPGASYEEHSVPVEDGTTLVLYTDGLIEERTRSLDDGFASLTSSLRQAPDDLEGLCDHLLGQCLGSREGADDDTAILAVRLVALQDTVKMCLSAHPGTLRDVRSFVRRWLRHTGIGGDDAFDVLVATGEACANAIRHAPVPGTGDFELELDRNGHIEVTVRNRGRWRHASSGDGGRGLSIMRELMDDVEVRKGPPETVVVMRRAVTGRG